MRLDLNALRSLTEGDPDIERELAMLFCATAERCLVTLSGFAIEPEEKPWAACLHELRGAALNMHADELADLCGAYEHEPFAGRAPALEALRAAYMALKKDLVSLISPR